jgi:hypothetical protein
METQTDMQPVQTQSTQEQFTKTQLFVCPYKNCLDNKVMYEKSEELCVHIDTNHNLKKKYRCGICTYCTINLDDMIKHSNKNHMCHWCEYSLAKSYVELNKHVNNCHFCRSCDKYYPSKSTHNSEHHDCVIS